MGQPDAENTTEHYEVVVIGAGQAGLAMGYFLSRQKRRFLIVERAGSVGSAWRERWDSLTLFTSRAYDSLPGLDFPGDAAGYPNRDEVIGYLEEYARRFELPVSLNTTVRRLGAGESGGYILDTDRERSPQTKSSLPPGRSSSLSFQQSPRNSHTRSLRLTASSTEGRPKCRRERSSSSGAETPVSRSRKNCPRPTTAWFSRSVRGRRPFPNECLVETSSGG